ncbi:MAG: RecX family transcriptional regulator [Saprospiraceae bacterium]|uniref:Regulatory protein RecX n=1 Tax=Candidatus Defluviibacterium haderslevense TaxID=2981993 RepID=A0A9D7XCM1_9BACT|nr:RecX family transcriptional regulator [Candidatus Defluviibacterium haderslevense]
MAKIYSTRDIFLEKMKKYCSYQERSHADVNKKLYELQLDAELRDEITFELIQQNFLNEERFARAIVRGKFRMNDWGKIKIKQQLKQHHIVDSLIHMAMTEIDEEEYLQKIKLLIQKKYDSLSNELPFKRFQKTILSLVQKGYEQPLVFQIAKNMNLEKNK